MPLAPDDPRHGRYTTYTNHRCRCPACREANRVYIARRRAQRYAEGLPPDDPRHGTTNAYNNWGCRCTPCRESNWRKGAP